MCRRSSTSSGRVGQQTATTGRGYGRVGQQTATTGRGYAAVVAALLLAWAVPGDADESPRFKLESIRGRVVYLAEAMEQRHGAPAVPEARDRVLALQTPAGELVPLLEDVRGRAFRRDERLRAMEVELLVRRYTGSPVVQIIRVAEVAKDGNFEIDYWCDICAIAMFEKKDCECCQGETELRRRKVE